MPRRVHVEGLIAGRLELNARNSHYLRDVLRIKVNAELELFDDAGFTALAQVVEIAGAAVIVEAQNPRLVQGAGLQWSIASAVPKGSRADWMVEKLSEFGASAWIPLTTERSVVNPESSNKSRRWQRIAEESARQCRRAGVMRIETLTPLDQMIEQCTAPPHIGLCLQPGAAPFADVLSRLMPGSHPVFLIGPEGGWSDRELQQMQTAGIGQFALAATILRIETAAIAIAAIAQMRC